MDKTYSIPLKHQLGTYNLSDLTYSDDNALTIEYQDYGDIIEYEHPDNGINITLYGIKQNDFEQNLKAVYNENGELKTLLVNTENDSRLLFIYYDNTTDTRQQVLEFAESNADVIIEKILKFTDTAARLFIEYFRDGEYFDFHAKIGTPEQKSTIEKKYPQYKDIADFAGGYPSENIYGDNDRLGIMLRCEDIEENYDLFNLAVDLMISRIKEKAVPKINKSDDFKFIVGEYD